MTAFTLQEDLAHELRELLSEFRIKEKEEYKPIRVLVQDIPFTRDKQEADNLFPYIIVRLEEGSISNDKNICQVVLIFGVHNEDKNRQGYKDLLNLMQKVMYHYATEKIIVERYCIGDTMEWLIQDGDNIFPHFIGAVSFEVELPMLWLFDKNI